MLRPKKNSYKEFDNEKKFLRLENSPPPHNVSNGLSLKLNCSAVKLTVVSCTVVGCPPTLPITFLMVRPRIRP